MALNDLLDSFGKEMWAITSKPNSYLERKYGKEIADIWKDFEISDPYAMCFAFMSLLDKGSDLPWCYCAGVNLHACYAASLPWPRMKFHPYNDGIWYHCEPDQEGFSFGPDGSELPKKIRVFRLNRRSFLISAYAAASLQSIWYSGEKHINQPASRRWRLCLG